jgi:hypothetical protein
MVFSEYLGLIVKNTDHHNKREIYTNYPKYFKNGPDLRISEHTNAICRGIFCGINLYIRITLSELVDQQFKIGNVLK